MRKQWIPGSLFPRPPRAWVRGYCDTHSLCTYILICTCTYTLSLCAHICTHECPHTHTNSYSQTHSTLNAPPAFGAILPQGEPLAREDSVDGLNTLVGVAIPTALVPHYEAFVRLRILQSCKAIILVSERRRESSVWPGTSFHGSSTRTRRLCYGGHGRNCTFTKMAFVVSVRRGTLTSSVCLCLHDELVSLISLTKNQFLSFRLLTEICTKRDEEVIQMI